jgi:hypothetical protein
VLNEDGSFTYTPRSGFTGIDTFTYDLRGIPLPEEILLQGGSGNVIHASSGPPSPHDTATVVITVLPEGSVPRLLVQDGHESTDEGGLQRLPGWAALTIEGASGNLPAGQRFELTTDRPELFAQLPAIDSSGQLLYTPAPNVSGTAIVTVKLVRSEGNLTTAQSFTINITKPHRFHNTAKPLDVTRDNGVAPDDALAIINYLNGGDESAPNEFAAAPYYDVSGDGLILPNDALMVINHINGLALVDVQSFEAEGEPSGVEDTLALLAQDMAEQAARRRRGS